MAGGFGAGVPAQATGRYLVSVLRQLGYRASLRVINPNTYYQRAGDSRSHVQIGEFDWYQDFPAPSDFIDPLFTCRSFLPDNPANINDSEFCNQRIDAQMHAGPRARSPQSQRRRKPLGTHRPRDSSTRRPGYRCTTRAPWSLVSARVGNYQFDPFWTVLIDQLWVQ